MSRSPDSTPSAVHRLQDHQNTRSVALNPPEPSRTPPYPSPATEAEQDQARPPAFCSQYTHLPPRSPTHNALERIACTARFLPVGKKAYAFTKQKTTTTFRAYRPS